MNSSNSSTMFAHIVSRLTNRTVYVAVEALGFILFRFDATRRGMVIIFVRRSTVPLPIIES